MTLLKIAWRNILRNGRRSIITLLAMVIGIAGLIFFQGYMEGVNGQMVATTTTFYTGHLQVHRKGFLDDPALSKRIKDPDPVAKFLQSTPNIAAISPRLESGGLVSSTEKSLGALVVGIDPAAERQVATLYKAVTRGRFLEPGDTGKVVMDKGAADKLKISLGDSVVVISQGADGSIATGKFELVGLFDVGMEEVMLIPLKDAQEFYVVGNGVTGFAVRLKEMDKLPETLTAVKALEAQGMEIDPWQELIPAMAADVQNHRQFVGVLLIFVFGIVGMGIMNTISMSVMGRTREFGIMMALGTRPDQIFRVVIYEALLLCLVGAAAGSFIGFGILFYYVVMGMDYSAFADLLKMMPGLPTIFYPRLYPGYFVTTTFWILLVTVLVSLYPALRAAGLEPVLAIRDVRRTVINPKISALADRVSHLLFPGRWVFLLMAWRNLTRNFFRTGVTLLALGISLGAMVFLYGYVAGFYDSMVENYTRYLIGDIKVAPAGFLKERSPSAVVREPEKVIQSMREENNITAFSRRVEADGLLSTAENTMGVLLLGVDPQEEKGYSRLDEVVKEGRYLTPEDKNSILIGSRLAEKLKLSVGDKVVAMVQDSQGNMSAEAFRVQGIIHTGVDSFDSLLAVVPMKTAQSLLAIDGFSTVVARIKNQALLERTQNTLVQKLTGSGNEIGTWKEVVPLLEQLITWSRYIMGIMMSIFFAIVLFGVMNTLLMSVLERTREFGMMMALGTKRYQVVLMVLLESLFLGVLGVALGDLLGWGVVQLFGHFGLNLSSFGKGALEQFPGMQSVIYTRVGFQEVFTPSVVIFLFALLAGLYPGWKAASIEPAKTLRRI